VLDSVPRRRRIVPSRRVSIAGVLLVLAATAAALLIAGLSGKDHPRPTGGNGGGGTPSGEEVELTSAQDFDPEGGDGEHPDEVKLAIDGIPNTTWQTETYTAGPDLSLSGKSGVGLIVEAADRDRPDPDRGHHDGRLERRHLRQDSGPPTEPGQATPSADQRANARQLFARRPRAGEVLPDLVHEAGGGGRWWPRRSAT
jgi:hypothetical protein